VILAAIIAVKVFAMASVTASRRRQCLRAQAKASMPASCNHFTICWFTKINHTTLHSDFRFPATVLWTHKQ